MAKKIMYNEINEKADSLFTKQNDWKQILSLYGCQDFKLQPLLFSWKKWDLIKALENISYAAGQLANIRREKDTSGKWVYPIKNLKAARHLALTALDQLLERDPMNTKGLHNKAYIHYNTVIASNNKIVPIYRTSVSIGCRILNRRNPYIKPSCNKMTRTLKRIIVWADFT